MIFDELVNDEAARQCNLLEDECTVIIAIFRKKYKTYTSKRFNSV